MLNYDEFVIYSEQLTVYNYATCLPTKCHKTDTLQKGATKLFCNAKNAVRKKLKGNSRHALQK